MLNKYFIFIDKETLPRLKKKLISFHFRDSRLKIKYCRIELFNIKTLKAISNLKKTCNKWCVNLENFFFQKR